MLDHIMLTVTDFTSAKRFYGAALAPLGYEILMSFPEAVGMGTGGKADFWLGRGPKNTPALHVAFRAASRSEVDAFYEAALAAGGTDNGAPGVRSHYHPNYYGAFVRDSDGNNVEAVCHDGP